MKNVHVAKASIFKYLFYNSTNRSAFNATDHRSDGNKQNGSLQILEEKIASIRFRPNS